MDNLVYQVKTIDELKSHLNYKDRYITFPKFIFLCGKSFNNDDNLYKKTNRGVIEHYIKVKNKNVFIVLSEKLWEDSLSANIDLLTFEDFLAEISDKIILFTESPGSFCELGAFAYANKLFSKKLIIVIDEKYKNDKSFIMTGPVAKAEKDGAIIIPAPLEEAILSQSKLRNTIGNIVQEFESKSSPANKRTPNKKKSLGNEKIPINSFIIEILELLKIVQPIKSQDLIELYKKIKGFPSFTFVKSDSTDFHNEIRFEYILKLLENKGLIKIKNSELTTLGEYNYQPLMFSIPKKTENRIRNKILCKKYRYGYNVT